MLIIVTVTIIDSPIGRGRLAWETELPVHGSEGKVHTIYYFSYQAVYVSNQNPGELRQGGSEPLIQ